MKYGSAGAFRQALESRLREQSQQSGLPLTRLRKMVAFDRLTARLIGDKESRWVIKGGYALQLRLPDTARTTKDIDAATGQPLSRAETALHRGSSRDLSDWFTFEIRQPSEVATGSPEGGLRFPVRCLLDGREFEGFHLDVGHGDPLPSKPDSVTGPPILEFAGIQPLEVPCYPLASQIAEKLHAYTRPYKAGQSSRVKDLVDILLIASLGVLTKSELMRAIRATFEARATHDIPAQLPRPPRDWSRPYRRIARELDLGWRSIDNAAEAAGQFLNPILQDAAADGWDPTAWVWR